MSKGLDEGLKALERVHKFDSDLHIIYKELKDNSEDYKIIENELKEHEQYKAIEKELGIDLVTFLKGVNPNTCFMEITKDKKFDFCGDAYHGTYSKEGLLKLIQELLFMYWALTREELE